MELLEISYKVQRTENTIYVEFYPVNPELQGIVFHGQDLPIISTVKAAIDDYMPLARQEILNTVNAIFGGSYQ